MFLFKGPFCAEGKTLAEGDTNCTLIHSTSSLPAWSMQSICKDMHSFSGGPSMLNKVPLRQVSVCELRCDPKLPILKRDGDDPSNESQARIPDRKPISKLTLGEKLKIINLYESPGCLLKSHESLARTFGKSRSAISKLLRPENVLKLKLMAASGVKPTVKRAVRQTEPNFDMAVRAFVISLQGQAQRRLQVQAFAKKLADQIGMKNFSGGRGWYAGFIKRHGLGLLGRRQPGLGHWRPAAHRTHDQQPLSGAAGPGTAVTAAATIKA
eukprot:760891-Hanusia_phi.AAC.1